MIDCRGASAARSLESGRGGLSGNRSTRADSEGYGTTEERPIARSFDGASRVAGSMVLGSDQMEVLVTALVT